MSGAELLQHVKALSPWERRKFLRAVETMRRGTSGRSKPVRRRVNWPDVQARAIRNSGGRVLPNLVLAEREEAAF